jgi:hypothetical protein
MSTGQSMPAQPSGSNRPRNGIGVAALVLGVASLVAVASFVLFPVGLIAGIVGLILGIFGISRARAGRATNRGQAIAGVVCCVLAVIFAIDLSVHVGTWVARNTGTFARFDKCVAGAANRNDVANCIAGFARDVRR